MMLYSDTDCTVGLLLTDSKHCNLIQVRNVVLTGPGRMGGEGTER